MTDKNEELIKEFKIKDIQVQLEEGTTYTRNASIDYDPSFGFKKTIWFFNPNRVFSATLVNMKFSDPKWKLKIEDNVILPLQTVKAKLEISKDEKSYELFIKDLMSGKAVRDLDTPEKPIQLSGRVAWSILPKEKELELRLKHG